MPKVESGITEVLNAVRETVQRRRAGRLSEASGDAPKTMGQGGNLGDWKFLDGAAVKSGESFTSLVDSWKELFGESVEAAREWVVGAGCWSPVAAKALQKAGVTPKQAATLAPPGVGTGSYTDSVGYKVSCGDLKVEEAQEFLSTVGGAERNLAGLPKERAASAPTKDATILEVFADTSTDAFDVLGRLRQALQPLPAVSLSRPDFDGKAYVLRVTGPAAVAEKARRIVHEALVVSNSLVAEYTVYVRSDSDSGEELDAAKKAIEEFASEQKFNWDVRVFSGETFKTKSALVVSGVVGGADDPDSAIEKVVRAMGYAGLSAAKESKFHFVVAEGRAYNRRCASCGTDLGEDKDEPALCPACKKAGKKLGEASTFTTSQTPRWVVAVDCRDSEHEDVKVVLSKEFGADFVLSYKRGRRYDSIINVLVSAETREAAQDKVDAALSKAGLTESKSRARLRESLNAVAVGMYVDVEVYASTREEAEAARAAVSKRTVYKTSSLSKEAGLAWSFVVRDVVASSSAAAEKDVKSWFAGIGESRLRVKAERARLREDDTDGGYDGLGGPAGTVAGDEGGVEVSPPDEGDEFDDEVEDGDEDPGDGTLKELKPGDTALLDIGEGAVEVTVSEGSDDKPYKKTVHPWGDEESPEETVYLVEIVNDESGETVTSYVRAQLLR